MNDIEDGFGGVKRSSKRSAVKYSLGIGSNYVPI